MASLGQQKERLSFKEESFAEMVLILIHYRAGVNTKAQISMYDLPGDFI